MDWHISNPKWLEDSIKKYELVHMYELNDPIVGLSWLPSSSQVCREIVCSGSFPNDLSNEMSILDLPDNVFSKSTYDKRDIQIKDVFFLELGMSNIKPIANKRFVAVGPEKTDAFLYLNDEVKMVTLWEDENDDQNIPYAALLDVDHTKGSILFGHKNSEIKIYDLWGDKIQAKKFENDDPLAHLQYLQDNTILSVTNRGSCFISDIRAQKQIETYHHNDHHLIPHPSLSSHKHHVHTTTFTTNSITTTTTTTSTSTTMTTTTTTTTATATYSNRKTKTTNGTTPVVDWRSTALNLRDFGIKNKIIYENRSSGLIVSSRAEGDYVYMLYDDGLLKKIDLRNPKTNVFQCFTMKAIKNRISNHPDLFDLNVGSSKITISGFDNRVRIFDETKINASVDFIDPIFVHDHESQVLKTIQHPTEKDLFLSSDDACGLHVWKPKPHH